jgi:NAD(P)-dependent dehydrogenase (short-subunit alcohol dehydrogenase family)
MNKWNPGQVSPQEGKIAIVTGANSGIGFEVAVGLVRRDFEVVMACRNLQKAEVAKDKILRLHPGAKINPIRLDTSSLGQVRLFADRFQGEYQNLHLLVNNAGVMMPPYQITEDGFENQLATNYIGHFALTGLLLPALTGTSGSRIISLTSLSYKWSEILFDDMHFEKGYSKTKAYGQSKRACLMFAFELQRRLSAHGFESISVAAHPGLCKTNLDQYYPALIRPFGNLFLQPAAKGALPVLYAALDEKLEGGEFVGPDGWLQIRGLPKIIDADRYSNDREIAKRLWDRTQNMTNVFYLTD